MVLERSFAEVLGVGAGGQITLSGRSFRVAGVAVTAASDLSNPQICFSRCDLTVSELAPGLVWMTRPDAVSLATTAEPRKRIQRRPVLGGLQRIRTSRIEAQFRTGG